MFGSPRRLLSVLGTLAAVLLSAAAWPAFAPWVGAMGAFVAGSNTVSDLMFALFHYGVAVAAGLPVTLVLGLQALPAI